jgi:hypothetical protein
MASSPIVSIPSDSPKVEKANPWAVLFFAVFFFLCCSDQFFATRVLGYNLRWGQLILLGLAIAALFSWFKGFRSRTSIWRVQSLLFFCWIPFFLVYALAAFFSETPQATFLKWAWAIFNIGGAVFVCLSSRWGPSFEKGFYYAAIALAGILWLQTLSFSWFGLIPGPDSGCESFPLHIPGLPWLPLGYMQISLQFLGNTYYRPNAFYYEPSYAGAALSFALPLVMALSINRSGWKSAFSPALVLTAIIFCSSRTGMLAAAISLAYIVLHSLFQRRKEILFQVLQTLLLSFLMIAVFAIPSTGRNYCRFILGPLGVETAQRVVNPQSSEGSRIANFADCISLWSRHLVLGNGVVRAKDEKRPGLKQISMNTWLEIGIESGVLGFSAFLFAILGAVFLSLKQGWKTWAALFAVSAWLAHFSVRFNFSQTFPRLDYWLFFFLSIRLLIQPLFKVIESHQKKNQF